MAGEEPLADAAEDLQVGYGLTLRQVGLMDLLLAPLEVRERPLLLGVDGRGEKDVGEVVERMVGVPRMDDEELGLAELGDDGGGFGALAGFGGADGREGGWGIVL